MSEEQINILNVDALTSSLQLMTFSLDKATQKGIFSLEETFKISVSLNNISKALENLDKCQKVLIKQKEKQEQN